MKAYLQLLRPKHCIKNLLVVLPLVFSGRLLDPFLLWKTVCAVLAFCVLASLVYIINDIRDVERDRQHPTKCRRPIASGAVPVSCAVAEEVVLFGILIVLSQLGQFPLKSWLCMGTYFVLNLGYSFGWKNVPILDIAILVSGFLLRMLLGTSVTGIAISGWLYLTVTSVSFYMGLGKRRGELRTVSKSSRKVLQYYSDSFLTQNMQMCLTLTVVFYSLWSMDRGPHLMWTVPLVLCICLRYSMTVEGNSDGDPVEVIFQDKVLLLLGAVFMATDYVTSPMNHRGMLLYGVCIGLLTVVIRLFGAYPEGMSFAILIMNAFTPLINTYVKPKRFGEVAKKK